MANPSTTAEVVTKPLNVCFSDRIASSVNAPTMDNVKAGTMIPRLLL